MKSESIAQEKQKIFLFTGITSIEWQFNYGVKWSLWKWCLDQKYKLKVENSKSVYFLSSYFLYLFGLSRSFYRLTYLLSFKDWCRNLLSSFKYTRVEVKWSSVGCAVNGVRTIRIVAHCVRVRAVACAQSSQGVPHGGKVVGGGVFRCCVPWCGARAAAPVDEADHALREGSPQLSHHEFGESYDNITCF